MTGFKSLYFTSNKTIEEHESKDKETLRYTDEILERIAILEELIEVGEGSEFLIKNYLNGIKSRCHSIQDNISN